MLFLNLLNEVVPQSPLVGPKFEVVLPKSGTKLPNGQRVLFRSVQTVFSSLSHQRVRCRHKDVPCSDNKDHRRGFGTSVGVFVSIWEAMEPFYLLNLRGKKLN